MKTSQKQNISQFVARFLEEPSKKAKAKDRRREIMNLFNDYLANYGEIASNVDHAPLVVTAPISELRPGHFRLFLSWFVIQKVIMDENKGEYASVLKEFVEWLKSDGALHGKALKEVMEVFEELEGEPERCEKLARLLYEFAQRDMPKYEEWRRDPKAYARKAEVLRAIHHQPPKEVLDGYFTVARVGPTALWLTPEDPDMDEDSPGPGKGSRPEIGPVQVPAEAAKLARVGDGISAAIGKMAGFWKILETGSVYPGRH